MELVPVTVEVECETKLVSVRVDVFNVIFYVISDNVNGIFGVVVSVEELFSTIAVSVNDVVSNWDVVHSTTSQLVDRISSASKLLHTNRWSI